MAEALFYCSITAFFWFLIGLALGRQWGKESAEEEILRQKQAITILCRENSELRERPKWPMG